MACSATETILWRHEWSYCKDGPPSFWVRSSAPKLYNSMQSFGRAPQESSMVKSEIPKAVRIGSFIIVRAYPHKDARGRPGALVDIGQALVYSACAEQSRF